MLSLSRPVSASLSLLAANSSGGGSLASLGIFLLIPIAMYFLLIRPQRRRQKDQASQQASIGVGDEIMTTSGVYGFVTGFEGDIVWVEIDDNVQIRMARAAIQRKVDTSAGSTAGDVPSHKPDESSRSTSIPEFLDDASGGSDASDASDK
jgi:preprotein translocase subunit YajC